MILLTLLDIIYAVVVGLTSAVFPLIPQQIDSILLYVLSIIDNGLDIVFTLFVDQSLVTPVLSWIISTQLVMLSIDLVWRIIDIIKLRRKPS